jgi:short-subunit dehydrogenase
MERRALITGAGSGMGMATALELARLGFTAIGLVPDEQEAEGLAVAAENAGVAIRVVQADLTDPPARAAVVKDLHLYALVNNAGFMNAGLLRDISIDDARLQLEGMVLAPLDLARRALPFMLRRGEGKIVNVTSAAAHTATPFTGWYQACKAALRELTDSLRLELADTGIDAIDVEPGGFRTGIWSRTQDELRVRQAVSSRPETYCAPLAVVDRLASTAGDPADVAAAIGRILTTADPPAHLRIGEDAAPLRVLSELVPDHIWDRVTAKLSSVS